MEIRPFFALAALALGLSCVALPLRAADATQVQALMRKGQHAQALEAAERLLATDARDPQLRFFRGVALTSLGRHDEAIATFEKLIEDFPELPEPYNNLAVLYAQRQHYGKARAALEMAIRTHPDYAVAHENMGDVYTRLAQQSYERAVQLDATNEGARNKLARLRDGSLPTRAGTKGAAATP